MRKRLLLTGFAAAAATTMLLAACKATDTAGNVNGNAIAPMVAAAQTTNPNDARRVTVDELKKMLEDLGHQVLELGPVDVVQLVSRDDLDIRHEERRVYPGIGDPPRDIAAAERAWAKARELMEAMPIGSDAGLLLGAAFCGRRSEVRARRGVRVPAGHQPV